MKSVAGCAYIALICCFVFVAAPALAQDGLRSLKTVHLDVNYEGGVPEAEARTIADYLQADYEYLRKKLGIELTKRLEVRVFDSGTRFLSESKQRGKWRVASHQHGVVHVLYMKERRESGSLERSLSFELALALLDDAAARGCPRWLRESFAVYHCGEMTNLSVPVGLKLSYFTDLDQNIQQYPDPPQRNDVHYVLGTTMRFLVDRYREEKALGVFKSFDGTKSLEEVFKLVFGQEFVAIERSWVEHIASTTEAFKERK